MNLWWIRWINFCNLFWTPKISHPGFQPMRKHVSFFLFFSLFFLQKNKKVFLETQRPITIIRGKKAGYLRSTRLERACAHHNLGDQFDLWVPHLRMWGNLYTTIICYTYSILYPKFSFPSWETHRRFANAFFSSLSQVRYMKNT